MVLSELGVIVITTSQHKKVILASNGWSSGLDITSVNQFCKSVQEPVKIMTALLDTLRSVAF